MVWLSSLVNLQRCVHINRSYIFCILLFCVYCVDYILYGLLIIRVQIKGFFFSYIMSTCVCILWCARFTQFAMCVRVCQKWLTLVLTRLIRFKRYVNCKISIRVIVKYYYITLHYITQIRLIIIYACIVVLCRFRGFSRRIVDVDLLSS